MTTTITIDQMRPGQIVQRVTTQTYRVLPTPTHVGLTTCGHGDPDLDVQQHIIRPEVPPREHAAWDGSRTWTTYAVLCNQSARNPILTPLADAPDGVKWCPICVGRYLQRAGKLGAAMKRVQP